MDPLGSAASLVTVLELCGSVVKYIKAARCNREARERLRDEVRACQYLLQKLQDEADDSEEGKRWSDTIKALETEGAPLGRLEITLKMVANKLEPKEGFKKTVSALTWPFNEKEMEKIFAAMAREVNLLQLALQNDARLLIQDIQRTSSRNEQLLKELADTIHGSEQNFLTLQRNLASVLEGQTTLQGGMEQVNRYQTKQQAVETQRQILGWLAGYDYTHKQAGFIRTRHPRTGQWLLDSSEFKTWADAGTQTLFCPGIPGAGKTIITSIVIDELFNRFGNNENIGIAYAYCDYRQEVTLCDLLTSLLKQLVQRRTSLPQIVTELYEKHKQNSVTQPSVEDVLAMLQSTAAQYSRCFVIVDALDELSRASRTRFLHAIFTLQAACGANFFATSRPIPEISDRFTEAVSIQIRAAPEDVRRYVDGRFDHLPAFVSKSRDLQNEIITEIVKAVDGMFLLAQLHLDSLADKMTVTTLRTALAELPTGSEAYSKAYESAMNRIKLQQVGQADLAFRVLAWITCAKRLLTANELQTALAVEIGKEAIDKDNFTEVQDMVSVCAGLVTVDEEGIIRLVHLTTQKYLERTKSSWFPTADSDIADICVTYLSFDVFLQGDTFSWDLLGKQPLLYTLYDYATKHWGDHARDATAPSRFITSILLCEPRTAAIFRYRSADIPGVKGESQGYIWRPSMAYGESYRSCSTISSQIAEIYRAERHYIMQLFGGHESVIKLLLDKGVEVDPTDVDQRTPLHHAALGGHESVIRLLLDKGVEVDPTDVYKRSPLSYAAEKSFRAVQTLLENGASASSKDLYDKTPLMYAAKEGYTDIFRLLLEKDAQLEIADVGRQLLQSSATRLSATALAILLQKGADINSVDEAGAEIETRNNKSGRTLLSFASQGGWKECVEALLEVGAKTETRCLDAGRTPLSYAAGPGRLPGRKATTMLLIQAGAQIETTSATGRTPLSYAAETQYGGVIESLLDAGADMESRCSISGQTPLTYAVLAGCTIAVKVLVRAGADCEARNNDGQTPLSLATQQGHKDIVKLLMEHRAKV